MTKTFAFAAGLLVVQELDDKGAPATTRTIQRGQLEAFTRDPELLKGAPAELVDQVGAEIAAVRAELGAVAE